MTGCWKRGVEYYLGNELYFTTDTPYGSLMIYALDGLDIAHSQKLVLKMVTRAENGNEKLERSGSEMPLPWALTNRGDAPVQTFGQPTNRPTRVYSKGKQGKEYVCVWMQNGTWEAVLEEGKDQWLCDTSSIRYRLRGK